MWVLSEKESWSESNFCVTIASLEALDLFNNSQVTWADAASYEAALQKDSTLWKHVTPEQCVSKNIELVTELRGNSQPKSLSISGM